MPFVLEISGNSRVTDPTDEQIRQAVLTLDSDKETAFVILSPSVEEAPFMQCIGDPRIGFTLEYQERNFGPVFRAEGDFDANQIISLLIAYRNGDEHWRTSNRWEQVDLDAE